MTGRSGLPKTSGGPDLFALSPLHERLFCDTISLY